jgi:hypothetical protein
MNALLSSDNIIMITLKHALFIGQDLILLRVKRSEPILAPLLEMESLPKAWQMYLELAGQVMSHIKTYDQEVYETKIEDDIIDKNLVTIF